MINRELLSKWVLSAGISLFLLSDAVQAGQIVPVQAEVYAQPGHDGGVFFEGNFDITLSDETRDVLKRGLTLTFVLDVVLEKKRWYWVDRKLGKIRESIRLSYNPMTRQYRVNVGGMNQSFDSLEKALQLISVTPKLLLSQYRAINGQDYEVQARFYLDTKQLPQPFQVGLKKDSGWELDTDWFEVKIRPSGE